MSKLPPIVGSKSSGQVTTFIKGQSYTLTDNDRRFNEFFNAIKENKTEDNIEDILYEILSKTIENEIQQVSNGQLEFKNGQVYYDGKVLHNVVCEKIKELYNDGLPFDGLFSFLEKLMENPDSQCVDRLYLYLEKNGLPIINEGEHKGCFISYKSVKNDYSSWHVGTDGVIIYSKPNTYVKMRRNLVDSNHSQGCSRGLHCGAISYVNSFHGYEGRKILVAVDPKNVVTVPYESCEKLRCCEYYVIGDYNEDESLKGSLYNERGEQVPPTTVFVEADWENLSDEFSDDYEEDYDLDDFAEEYEDYEKPQQTGFLPQCDTKQKQCCGNDNWKNMNRDKFGRFRSN